MGLLTLNVLTAQNTSGAAQDYLWLVITVIALAALVVSVVNAFRITQIKKMLEVNLVNQKEDMELSFKKIKSSLGRDLGNIRRELKTKTETKQPNQKPQANQKPQPKKSPKANNADNTNGEKEGEQQKKKVVRKPQRRKYPPKQKKAPVTSGEKNEEK